MRVRIVDLAIERRLSYREAYDRALKGEFGPVEREGSKIFVRVESADIVREPVHAA